MNPQTQMFLAQDRINERLAEAQRERLIRAARASQPRPIEFHALTGSFASLVVQPFKSAIAAVVHAVHHPVVKVGGHASH